LRLSTAADIVADPSAPDAFVNGIMEGVEWLYDPVKDSWLEQKLHDTRNKIHKMTMSQLEENRLAIMEDYITSLAVKK
jgi:hypothetical protein